MKNSRFAIALSLLVLVAACHTAPPEQKHFESEYAKGTFGYDLDFLKQTDSVVVLNTKNGSGQVIVSPKYQAKCLHLLIAA